MPRHPKDHKADQERWKVWGQNPPQLQPRPAGRGTSTPAVLPAPAASGANSQPPRDRIVWERGLDHYCEVMDRDSAWKELQATIDGGRKCSYLVDMRQSVADPFGHRLERFPRKMYRTFNGKEVKAIGTMNFIFKLWNGEEEEIKTLIWEDNNVSFQVRVHHTLAPRLAHPRGPEPTTEAGPPGQPNASLRVFLPASIDTVVGSSLEETTRPALGTPQGTFPPAVNPAGNSLGNFETQRYAPSQFQYSSNQTEPGASENQNNSLFPEARSAGFGGPFTQARSAGDANPFANQTQTPDVDFSSGFGQLGAIRNAPVHPQLVAADTGRLQTQLTFSLNDMNGGRVYLTERNAPSTPDASMASVQAFPTTQSLDVAENLGMSSLASTQPSQPRMNLRRRQPSFGEPQNPAPIGVQTPAPTPSQNPVSAPFAGFLADGTLPTDVTQNINVWDDYGMFQFWSNLDPSYGEGDNE